MRIYSDAEDYASVKKCAVWHWLASEWVMCHWRALIYIPCPQKVSQKFLDSPTVVDFEPVPTLALSIIPILRNPNSLMSTTCRWWCCREWSLTKTRWSWRLVESQLSYRSSRQPMALPSSTQVSLHSIASSQGCERNFFKKWANSGRWKMHGCTAVTGV